MRTILSSTSLATWWLFAPLLSSRPFLAQSTTSHYHNEIQILPGHTKQEHITSPLPHTYVSAVALPDSFHWGNVNGVSYLTPSLNQHLPQYCGSCWAHGSLSALADRIKIARGGLGDDIQLSIQFILNCGADIAGSCHGGYHTGVYEMIQTMGYVPYLTCMPYLSCSAESTEGICPFITEQLTCESQNICRTCDTFGGMGGKCTEIDFFPNATVAEYGMIASNDIDQIMTEIYTRGPVAATINAEPIVEYRGGVFSDTQYSQETNHIVSIVGWGTDKTTGKKHWIVRNSWGQYWGEMGYIRVEMGQNILGLEGEVAWATPGSWTEVNFPCGENGKYCNDGQRDDHHSHHQSNDKSGYPTSTFPTAPNFQAKFYKDPSQDVQSVQRRLEADNRR